VKKFNFFAVPARWRSETSLAADHLPLDLPVGAGILLWLLPGAAGGSTPPHGRRRPAEVRLLHFGHDLRPTALSPNADGAGHEAETAGHDAPGSVGCAGAPATSAGRAAAAGASCAGGAACWWGGGIDGGSSTLVDTARGTEANAGW